MREQESVKSSAHPLEIKNVWTSKQENIFDTSSLFVDLHLSTVVLAGCPGNMNRNHVDRKIESDGKNEQHDT